MQFVIIRPRSYNKQHVDIMHVSLLMFSAVKDKIKPIMPDASSDIHTVYLPQYPSGHF